MHDYVNWAISFVTAFAITAGSIPLLLRYLRNQQVVAEVNQRSNHKAPVPVGGGLAILLAYFVTIQFFPSILLLWPVHLAMLLLGMVSWCDDRCHLPALQRLGFQVIAVVLGLFALSLMYALPVWLWALLFIGWLWFINLYNFMDGIDGIMAVETFSICAGFLGFAFLVPVLGDIPIIAALFVAASLGFLFFNWHPAKLFAGDVGSVPVGYIMGFLLCLLVVEGAVFQALLLPLVFVADATYTLAKRALQRKPIMQAHSEHCYQQAVRAGRSHSRVVISVFVVNMVLCSIVFGITAMPAYSFYGALVGLLCVAASLYAFTRGKTL